MLLPVVSGISFRVVADEIKDLKYGVLDMVFVSCLASESFQH